MAGFFIVLLINGCSSQPKLPDSLLPLVELTQTPFFPQEEHQCGPAALATVLNYRDINVTPDELVPQVFLPGRKGSLQIELAATSRRYGMLAYPLSTELSDLLAEVAAGNPVLVLQNLALDWLPQWHYAVVVGYNLEQNEVILRSGRHRRWLSKLSAFNNTWRRAGNWALVILPPDEIPQTAQSDTFLKSAFDLEAKEKQQEALSAYRAASVRWPDEQRTWLALGNGAFKLNRLDEAQTALKQAVYLDPSDAIVLNNLAYVYLAAGCAEQAKTSIRKALHLKPEDKNLQDSKQEIDSKSSLIIKDGCRISH
ncbi:MAG: PA2778 family cysteine peptidase [Gammaproteobacteria bacterium]|nr:PA2778 family cysteine peptidase [Gammaproteobacteria bacterium]